MWHFPFSLFFIRPCSPIFNYPVGERQSRIPRQSHFQEGGEVWIRAHGSRRVAAEEKEAGIWLCWISPRCAVCQVREVTHGRGKKGGEVWGKCVWCVGVNEGGEVCREKAAGSRRQREREWSGFQPRSLRSVSSRGEMRLADGSAWKVSSLSKWVMTEKAKNQSTLLTILPLSAMKDFKRSILWFTISECDPTKRKKYDKKKNRRILSHHQQC